MYKSILLAATLVATGLAFSTPTPAVAKEYQWCGVYPGNAGRNCGFSSYRQCMAAVSGGGGGFCERNQFAKRSRR